MPSFTGSAIIPIFLRYLQLSYPAFEAIGQATMCCNKHIPARESYFSRPGRHHVPAAHRRAFKRLKDKTFEHDPDDADIDQRREHNAGIQEFGRIENDPRGRPWGSPGIRRR